MIDRGKEVDYSKPENMLSTSIEEETGAVMCSILTVNYKKKDVGC